MGIIMASIVPYMMKTVAGISIRIEYPFVTLMNALLAGVVITLIASISPTLKSSKLNIIEAIKQN
ncbi:MAG: hypothetical protein K0R50_782 [Eubacterium sp.]|jgi:putative ABC transport system permease protein|nr:hypothetical protein [Eubacterium sp.]